jgi:hypothetical protein
MKSVLQFLVILLLSCNNPIAPKPVASTPPPSHELAKQRLAKNNRTDFLKIGYQIDTFAKNYASLKCDSIEAINYYNEGMIVTEGRETPKDTIFKRHVLNPQQTAHLIQVLDAEKTYDFGYMTKCFVPHLMFVFYSQDTIVAHCSVCFHCMNTYSTINSERINRVVNLTEYGDNMLSKLCKEMKFSDCNRDY